MDGRDIAPTPASHYGPPSDLQMPKCSARLMHLDAKTPMLSTIQVGCILALEAATYTPTMQLVTSGPHYEIQERGLKLGNTTQAG